MCSSSIIRQSYVVLCRDHAPRLDRAVSLGLCLVSVPSGGFEYDTHHTSCGVELSSTHHGGMHNVVVVLLDGAGSRFCKLPELATRT